MNPDSIDSSYGPLRHEEDDYRVERSPVFCHAILATLVLLPISIMNSYILFTHEFCTFHGHLLQPHRWFHVQTSLTWGNFWIWNNTIRWVQTAFLISWVLGDVGAVHFDNSVLHLVCSPCVIGFSGSLHPVPPAETCVAFSTHRASDLTPRSPTAAQWNPYPATPL